MREQVFSLIGDLAGLCLGINNTSDIHTLKRKQMWRRKEEGCDSAIGLLLMIWGLPWNGGRRRSQCICPNLHLVPLLMFLDFLMLKKKIAKCLYQTGTLSGGNLCKVSCCQVNKFFKNIRRQRQLEKAHSGSCHSPLDGWVGFSLTSKVALKFSCLLPS